MRHQQLAPNPEVRCFLLAAAIVLLATPRAGAQPPAETPVATSGVKDTPLVQAATKAFAIFDAPLHPILESVAPDGGLAAGIGYDFPRRGRWQTTTKAVVSVSRYWIAQFDTAYRGDRAELDAYARMRDMPEVSFFGRGMATSVEDRTTFRLQDPVVGIAGSVRVSRWVAVGGRVEELWPEVGRGRFATLPSIEDRFGEDIAPGLVEQPRFGRYQAFLEVVSPPALGPALNQGGRYRIAYGVFDDQGSDRFTFSRLDLEAQQNLELFGRDRRLILHGWVSMSDTAAGREVPFFLQHTLGGMGNLFSVEEYLLNTDSGQGTLRGFRNFRFRDRNLLLLQAEYRWPVWGPVDASVFMDAGKVTRRRGDLDLSDLERNYGFSLSVNRGTGMVMRMDVGVGGGEGAQLFFSFGRHFLGSRGGR